MDIINLSGWEMREKLLNKEISSREIVKSHLDRIDKVEENINAFITIDKEKALKDADMVDEKIKNGENVGILAGIPIGIKDNIITKDFRTTAGSKMLENFTPIYDATVVKKVKENDGIILGKTNLDEFAMGGTTQSSYFGPTKNPLDETKIPGGSSGGSAAAIAAKEVALSLGSDTGGSIRIPASYCGIVGIKPTYGLVSRYGLISLSNSLDQIGVFGKDVRDAVLMLNAVSGHDSMDTTSINNDIKLDIESLVDSLKGMKIGLPKEYLDLEMDPKVKEEMDKAINILKDGGAIIEEVSLPNIKYANEAYNIIVCGDASSNMARFDGIRYGYRAADYETLDELYIKSRTEAFGDEVKKRILLGTYLLSGQRGDEYYKKAQKVRTLIINDFNNIFSKYDTIICPTATNLPFNLGGSRPSKYYNYNEAINLAGLCSISIPTSKGDGLSVGLQIIGDRFKESNIIKAALAYEGMVK